MSALNAVQRVKVAAGQQTFVLHVLVVYYIQKSLALVRKNVLLEHSVMQKIAQVATLNVILVLRRLAYVLHVRMIKLIGKTYT